MKHQYFLLFVLLCFSVQAQNSLLFNGNQYVRIKNPSFSNFLDESFAVEATINQAASTPTKQFIMRYYKGSTNEGFSVFIRPNGKLIFKLNEQSYTFGSFEISTNTCYTFSIVRRNSKLRMYINGVLQKVHNITTAPVMLPNNKDFFIGGKPSGTKNFIGEIDEVRLYKKAINTNWINSHLNNTLATEAQNKLTAYYTFNETQTQVVIDTKGLNNGILGADLGNNDSDPFRSFSNCIDIDRRLVCTNIDLKQGPDFECPLIEEDDIHNVGENHYVTDRFGNIYCEHNLTGDNFNRSASYTTDGGMFQLEIGTMAYPQMCQVIMQVFEDLEELLIHQPDTCTGELYTAKILINSNALFPGQSATGTALFPHRKEAYDVHKGLLADRITGKAFRDGNVAVNIPFDGTMTISNAILNWYLGYDGTAIPAGQYDFYSVVLHQAIHILGFDAGMTQNGDHFGVTEYGLFGTRLYDTNIQESVLKFYDPGILDINFNWQNNTTAAALRSGCQNITYESSETGSLPIYAPPFFVNGVSLAHIDNQNCSVANAVLMSPSLNLGVFERIQDEDINVLRDLGYGISNQFGASNLITGGINPNAISIASSDSFIAHDDFGPNCTDQYNYKVGDTPITLALSDIIANDAIGSHTVEFHSLVAINPGVTLSQSGQDYLFSTTENYTAGMQALRYMLKDVNGTKISGYGHIYIYVAPTDDYWTIANPDCNLLPNPYFSDYNIYNNSECYSQIVSGVYTSNVTDLYRLRPTKLSQWFLIGNSPDIIPNGCAPAGRRDMPNPLDADDRHMFLASGPTNSYGDNNEGFFTKTTIEQGKRYIFSYFRARGVESQPSLRLNARFFNVDELLQYPFDDRKENLANFNFLNNIDDVFSGTFFEIVDNDDNDEWEQSINCFVADSDYDALAFLASNYSSVMLDQIELMEDTFDETPVSTLYCGGATGVVIGQNTCTITNMIYSWCDVTDPANPIVLTLDTTITPDGIAAGITFPATNTTGSEIIVAPGSTSVYQLKRLFSSDPTLGGNGFEIAGNTCPDATANYTINVCAAPYISQTYIAAGTAQFIEVKNADDDTAITPNTFFLALYENGAPIGGPPTSSIDITAASPIAANEARTFKNSAALIPPLNEGTIDNLPSTFTFDGNNDIIILTTTTDNTAWANRIDIVGDNTDWANPGPVGNVEDWGQNQTWVRSNCASQFPNATYYDPCDWVSFNLTEVAAGNTYGPGSMTNPILGRHRDDVLTYNVTNGWEDDDTMVNPDRSRTTIIQTDYNTSDIGLGSFEACSLVINPFETLTIAANDYVSVQINVLVRAPLGAIDVQNNGSLVMVKDEYNGVVGPDLYEIEGGGDTTVEQSTVALDSPFDYVFWSTPLTLNPDNLPNNSINSLFPSPPFEALRFNDYTNANYYDEYSGQGYPQTLAGSDGFDDNGDDYGIPADRDALMIPGRGYASWPPQNLTTNFNYAVVFSGEPNNGVVSSGIGGADTAVYRNTSLEGDNFNLVGNPYPSAIDLDSFFEVNTALIEPIAYIWGRELIDAPIDPNGPLDNNYLPEAFLVYNPSMAVVVPSQFANSNPFNTEGILSSCQSFFVQTRQGGLAENNTGQANNQFVGDIVFNNSMRTILPNDSFSFTGSTSTSSFSEATFEAANSGKVWLNLVGESIEVGAQMGIAFMPEGNATYMSSEDAKTVYGRPVNIYSKSTHKELIIDTQASFDTSTQIPLGITSLINNEETFSIGIEKTEGVLASNPIYLEDRTLGIIHNLNESNYEFTCDMAVVDDRFVLRFDNTSTSLQDPVPNILEVITPNETDVVISTLNGMNIVQLEILDLYNPSFNGRALILEKQLQSTRIEKSITAQVKILYIKATLEDGSIQTKKVIR